MQEVVETLRKLATLEPPTLPSPEFPGTPEIAAVAPLAEVSGGDCTRLVEQASRLEADTAATQRIIQQAQPLIAAAGQDLVALAQELVSQAWRQAIGLVGMPPGAALAGLASLEALAKNYLQRGLNRIAQLAAELEELIPPLEQVAAAPVTSTTEAGSDDLSELESSSAPPPPVERTSTDGDGSAGAAAVDAALSQLGTPYVWGGTGNGGFDCSGFTQWAWGQAGVDIPRLAEDQATGRPVEAAELRKGDLIVWDGHVAMYAGDGQMVEAGDPVQTNPLRTSNMSMEFRGFWRPTG